MSSCNVNPYGMDGTIQKGTYGLSRCHTKRRTGAGGRTLPSFGVTPNLKKRDQIFFRKKKNKKTTKQSLSYQKKDIGMTRIQADSDLFA